ncbi:MAG: CehA/McbA family metallohydrolase [Bacteroidota bacterium]|nr:CehA/McbA family metallohydrolase [Bacteroidota bacterium]
MKTILLTLSLFVCLMISATSPSIGGYNVYYGHLHNHTSYSDGTGTPTDAYNYAKNTAKLDFFGLSDHDTYLDSLKWADTRTQANAFNQDGVFSTFYGFEWSSFGEYGHVTVVGTSDYTTVATTETFDKLKTWLSTRPGIAFFNHPGRENASNEEFDHFATEPSNQFIGMELWNKGDGFSVYYYNDGYTPNDNSKGYYDEALGLGWKIGATGSSDNHSGTWGTSEDSRMAILSNSLTRASLWEAMQSRRFYSTLDKNIALSFKINNQEMGSTLTPGTYTFQVQANDADGEIFTYIKLYNKAHNVVQTWTPNLPNINVSTNLATANGDYYYVKVTEADGDEAISSPIWIEAPQNPDSIPALTVTCSPSAIPSLYSLSYLTDGNIATSWKVLSPHASFITFHYANPRTFNQVALTSTVEDYPSRDPKSWTIKASNDTLAGWKVLDTRTNETFATRGLTKVYSFTNSTPYKFYRLAITESNYSTTSTMLGELAFLPDTQTPTDTQAPTAFTATIGAVTASSVELLLNATDDSGSVTYTISYGTGPTVITTTGVSATQKSYIVTGLTSSTNYTFSVVAQDAALNPAANNPIVVVAETSSAPNLTVTCSPSAVPSPYSLSYLTDGNTSTSWKVLSPHASFITFNYANPRTFNQVALTSTVEDYPSRDPKNWTIKASNDTLAGWKVLDTRTNETFATRGLTKIYSFTNSTPYKFYRLAITESNYSTTSTMLGELAFLPNANVASASIKQAPLNDEMYIRIDVRSNSYLDSMWVYIDTTSTHNLDVSRNIYKISGSANSPNLYFIESNGNYQVNSVENINNVELGFKPDEDTQYTLKFTHHNMAAQYTELYLIDLYENKYIDITQSGTKYTFTSRSVNMPEVRFKMATQLKSPSDITKAVNPRFKIYSSYRTLFVQNLTDKDGDLYLYDIYGRLIQKQPVSANGTKSISLNLPVGLYVAIGISQGEKTIKTLIFP